MIYKSHTTILDRPSWRDEVVQIEEGKESIKFQVIGVLTHNKHVSKHKKSSHKKRSSHNLEDTLFESSLVSITEEIYDEFNFPEVLQSENVEVKSDKHSYWFKVESHHILVRVKHIFIIFRNNEIKMNSSREVKRFKQRSVYSSLTLTNCVSKKRSSKTQSDKNIGKILRQD